MLRILLMCAAMLLLLNGCATYRNGNLARMQSLPQHYSQFDAKLAWEVKTDGNSTIIDGVVKNIRYYEMDGLEIWVSSLDAKGKEMNRAADFVYNLKENETAQFTVKLPKLASGSKLRFFYSYYGFEGGGDSGDDARWSQTFETAVP